jgi:SAM-dependent methyltransferase
MDNKTEWFTDWFDSPYYHLLYKNRDLKEAEVFIDNLIDFLKPDTYARFLDLACGKGRHSVYLNKKGFEVTGVDLSAKSIKYASQYSNDKLEFYLHDMRYPCRINYFDYVLNLFTSFGYFNSDREDAAVVSAMKKELKHNGKIIIDFMNVTKVIPNLITDETKIIEGITFNIHKKMENNFIVKQISIEDKGNRYFFEERVKALQLGDFEKHLATHQLKILNLFGNYQLKEFNPQTSDRLIIIAQKQ